MMPILPLNSLIRKNTLCLEKRPRKCKRYMTSSRACPGTCFCVCVDESSLHVHMWASQLNTISTFWTSAGPPRWDRFEGVQRQSWGCGSGCYLRWSLQVTGAHPSLRTGAEPALLDSCHLKQISHAHGEERSHLWPAWVCEGTVPSAWKTAGCPWLRAKTRYPKRVSVRGPWWRCARSLEEDQWHMVRDILWVELIGQKNVCLSTECH